MNVSRSNAYSGWEKPHIERFFRTLSHGLIELLPAYIGHCVADRQVIEARKELCPAAGGEAQTGCGKRDLRTGHDAGRVADPAR